MSPNEDLDHMEQRVAGGGAGGVRILAWLVIVPVVLLILTVYVWGWVAGQ